MSQQGQQIETKIRTTSLWERKQKAGKGEREKEEVIYGGEGEQTKD